MKHYLNNGAGKPCPGHINAPAVLYAILNPRISSKLGTLGFVDPTGSTFFTKY